jgi:hypothetical protein
VNVDRITSAGEFFAIKATVSFRSDPIEKWWGELILVDRSGNVRWAIERSYDQLPDFLLGDDGQLILSWNNDSLAQFERVSLDGTTERFSAYLALAAPDHDSVLPVLAQDIAHGVQGYGWLDLGSHAFRPFTHALDSTSYPYSGWSAPSGFVYASQEDEAVLVVETPKGATVARLASPTGGTTISSGDWALVTLGRTPQTWARVHLTTGEVWRVEEQLPAGLRYFTGQAPKIDGEGNLLENLRGDYAGGVYRSPDGKAWELVGESMNDIGGTMASDVAGTYVIEATTNETWTKPLDWPAAPAGAEAQLSGTHVQIARPANGVELIEGETSGMWSVGLSADGRCAAYWNSKTQTLNARDLVRQISYELIANASGSFAPVWSRR